MNAALPIPGLQRELGRELRSASDQQLSRVVAVVDALPERGAADALIAPVRARLAQLRPDRPLRLSRVLFTPLNAVIVATVKWRPASISVPRSALDLLGKLILAQIGTLRSELETVASQRTSSDATAIQAIGDVLWPAAGRVLQELDMPGNWTEQTGLQSRVWHEIRDGAAVVLNRAVRIEEITHTPDNEELLQSLLKDRTGCNDAGFALVVRVLLVRHPRPTDLLRTLANLRHSGAATATEQAISATLDDLEPALEQIETADPTAAVGQAVQLAMMFDALDTPTRRTHITALRADAARLCQERLERTVQQGLLEPLTATSSPSSIDFPAIETTARGVRKLGAAAQRLGGQRSLERFMQLSVTAILALDSPAIDPVDRIRLLEILVGPDAALAYARAPSQP
ncbi:MAG: hypothetical protein NVSMB18_20320 [Acetobacteraceae bacterium]